mmetsp:Transcript_125124/g.389505  ORF Transcript_125124/g.389505 Transcript_125124/m.389505 type:complete len:203 (+) Transcript_125124:155-763(+)
MFTEFKSISSSSGWDPNHSSSRASICATRVSLDTARTQNRLWVCDPRNTMAVTVISNSVPSSSSARSASVTKRSGILLSPRGRMSRGGGAWRTRCCWSSGLSVRSPRGPGSEKKTTSRFFCMCSSSGCRQSNASSGSEYQTIAFNCFVPPARLARVVESSGGSLSLPTPATSKIWSGTVLSIDERSNFTWPTLLHGPRPTSL